MPAPDPDAYVRALDGWRRDCVTMLRESVRKAPGLDEMIKWGNLVYVSNGPVLLIRAEDARVLLGFWRGKRLTGIGPRLKGGGKYEMATLEIREETAISPALVSRLARAAVRLNKTVGDPTKATAKPPKVKAARPLRTKAPARSRKTATARRKDPTKVS